MMPDDPMPPGAPSAPRYVDRDDGWTLAAELLTATFLWGGVGWLLDRWLGSGPVLMAIGFVLGNALGVYLLWVRSHERFTRDHQDLLARRARRTPAAAPPRPPAPAPVDRYHEPLEPLPPSPRRGVIDPTAPPPASADPTPGAHHG
jgi:F0F1-type ATP synthase assembly protein I